MYLIDINVSAEIDEYSSLRFQDIRKKKQNVTDGRTHGRTDNVKIVYPTTNKVCGGYNKNKKKGSFKSNENSHKKEDGLYYAVSANKASSVSLY